MVSQVALVPSPAPAGCILLSLSPHASRPTRQVGKMGYQKTRLAKGSRAAPQLKQLEEFGALLKRGMLAVVRADQAELHLEGKFWLVHIEGEAFPAPQDMALATDVFEEGYLVVATKWYELADKERRGYKLMPTVRHIMVNAMVFVTGLHFEGSQGGPQGRTLRQQPGRETGLSYLSQDMQNYILDAF